MNSPGHKANILNPIYTHLGVAALKYGADQPDYGGYDGDFYYWVQNFAKL